jgi:hypothetical protein
MERARPGDQPAQGRHHTPIRGYCATSSPGTTDAERGQWVSDRDATARAYRSTDNVDDPAWTGRPPSSVIEAIRAAGLQFDPETGTGVVLHMLSCLAVGRPFRRHRRRP